ncbi:MAG: hypothetical protein M3317_08155 [Actinomycetota bacterium]|nr:hypothetical protein [Actinomycetota bacterium]
MSLDLKADLYEVCRRISPRNPDYATLPIENSFEWFSLSCCLFERLYLIVSRSVRRPEADLDLLHEHDDRAYEEALMSGGLLRYFKGQANERSECLSFCLWETAEQARKAASAASHRSAAGITAQTYLTYTLERYWLKKEGEELTFERI